MQIFVCILGKMLQFSFFSLFFHCLVMLYYIIIFKEIIMMDITHIL